MDDHYTHGHRRGERAEPSACWPDDPRAYRRLAAVTRELISSGELGRGRPLPSITDVAREHGHARETCGKAYRMLEAEGLAIRYPGLGYYVA